MKRTPKLARNVDIRLRRSAVPGNVPTIEQLNLGELAVNTADGKLYLKRIYDGIEQVIEVGADAKSGLVSTFNTYIYTSDGTLQNVSGADDYGNFLSYDLASPRRIQVYLNGVLLHQGIDYTATDGSTISFVYPIDEGQVVQIAAYNSEGASIDADLIMDDGFSFTVGTDEETKFYHNGSNTILKHLAYGDNTFNMMWRDSDRLVMGEHGIDLYGNLSINGNTVVTDSDVLDIIDTTVDQNFVEALNLTAGAISYTPDSAGQGQTPLLATNVQAAIDTLHQEKLDINSLTSSVTFYPTTTFVDIDGGYTKMVTSIDDSDFNTTAVDINTGLIDSSDTFVAQLVSEKGVFEGSTGSINIHTVGNVRRHAADGTGEAEFYFEVYKIDSDINEYLLGTSSTTDVVSDDTYSQFVADALIQTTVFGSGDRVAFKYYGKKTTSNVTSFDFQFGGAQPIRSTFPVPLSVIPQEARIAADINVTTDNFNSILSGNDDTVQKALDTIDNITTADIPEDTNLFLTSERVRDKISASSGINYDQNTGEITADTNILATKIYSESYTEVYADSQDAITLAQAISNAQSLDSDNLVLANNYTDSAVANGVESAILQASINADSDDLALQNILTQYIDSQDNITLSLSTQYADSAINLALTNLVDGAPQVLDTLNELAEAIGDDSDFIGTVQNWINQKLDKTATTDEITEGTTNLYFTEERSRSTISAGNGLSYDPATGRFDIDSDISFDTVTATTFIGDLNGNADTATHAQGADSAENANLLDGQDGNYYRINVYNSSGVLLN